MNKGLWLNEAMIKYNKMFHKGVLNILNAPAGCGKSTFIFKEFLEESYKYVEQIKNTKRYYKTNLNKVLYVCDTNMLMSSILQESKGITKILEKNDLITAMKDKSFEDILNDDIGYVKVITYSAFGWLLKQDASRYIILNHLETIIMDEMHNLFKYANRFDNDENGNPYKTVIEYLPTLIKDILVVSLSATTGRIYSGIRELNLNTNTVFRLDEREKIRRYKEKIKHECKYIINEIKKLCLYKDFIDKHNYKVFIYTNTIRMSKKYKQQLEKYGYKAEWLCSLNHTKVNEDGEIIPIMNEYQLKVRQGLLEKGMLPDDLDVIIVNSGYETGWNLRDERVQLVYIDSTDEDTQIQARNRIRHDILQLVYTAIVDEEGKVLEYNQFREKIFNGIQLKESFLSIKLEEKFLGKKLTKADKDYLVDKYAIVQFDKKEANWKTFKKDLEINNYIVHNTNNGTYIYAKEDFEKINKKGVVNLAEKLINWLESEWDKKRITCQDVMDILDIGLKSFNKLIQTEAIINYFKEQRYTIGTIKGSKTKYLMKY